MHRRFAELGGGPIATDVCVIGAGVAGQTVAKALADGGREVLLLESGGFDYDEDVQHLNAAAADGLPYYDLRRARLRFFGGTSAIWGGRSCRLDPIDFEPRAWVPHSGWPFGYDDLVRYYEMAEARLGLNDGHIDGSAMRRVAGGPAFDPERITADRWQFDAQVDRFTSHRRTDLLDHPRLTVLTGATATEVVAHPDGAAVERIEVADLAGRRLPVRARITVVACGGIENARLLLASRSVKPAGLGNDSDWLGRTFMEHIHARGGEIVTRRPLTVLRPSAAFRQDGVRTALSLRAAEAVQRRAQVLNTSFTMSARRPADGRMSAYMKGFHFALHAARPTRGVRRLWSGVKQIGTRLQELVDPWRTALSTQLSERGIYAVVRAEQAPNRDSRITLDHHRVDALGMPRAHLHWTVSDLDKRSVGVTMAVLDDELRRLDVGHVERSAWLDDPSVPWAFDELISRHPIGGYHHMGTTRMADDPAQGVTDKTGKVHGLANLYVAGSSLFPTSGWANPTLTILALSFRLAEHLLT